jgi:S-adenosylmethionine:tRNA ribosyltransferase-isomerase
MSERIFTTSDFDFALPPSSSPSTAPERSASRLLDGSGPAPVDRAFRELPALLAPGDLLVFNDTQVVKARLFGTKPSGGRLELLIERVLPDGTVAAHMKVSKPPPGTVLNMDGGFAAELLGRWPDAGGPLFHLRLSGDAYALMAAHGHVPLPPYIEHADTDEDLARYQTVFAKNPGAVAAHGSAALRRHGAGRAGCPRRGARAVTLHVGAGTFQPVRPKPGRARDAPRVVPRAAGHAGRHRRLPRARRRVVAVGTTTLRTLEAGRTAARPTATPASSSRRAFAFRVVDALVTNFHLPRSTLMMLVSAFAGHAHVMALYRHAVAARYRFFSYGDAMWLVRPG